MECAAFFSTLDTLLDIRACDSIDSALNGVQVAGDAEQIDRVVTAVDASLETIRRAVAADADCLIVHHGLFWGAVRPIVGVQRARIAALLAGRCALYAAHLPLDLHPRLGNNIVIAQQLQLRDIEPFGTYRGVAIGYCGRLATPRSVERIERTLLQAAGAEALATLPFGAPRCSRIGIVSGGGASALPEAIERGLDLLITGDASYQSYYEAQEQGINVLFAGHYNTETWGVRALATHIQELGVAAQFVDLPTGL